MMVMGRAPGTVIASEAMKRIGDLEEIRATKGCWAVIGPAVWSGKKSFSRSAVAA